MGLVLNRAYAHGLHYGVGGRDHLAAIMPVTAGKFFMVRHFPVANKPYLCYLYCYGDSFIKHYGGQEPEYESIRVVDFPVLGGVLSCRI